MGLAQAFTGTAIQETKAITNGEMKGALELVMVNVNQVHGEQKNIFYQIIIHHVKLLLNMSTSLR